MFSRFRSRREDHPAGHRFATMMPVARQVVLDAMDMRATLRRLAVITGANTVGAPSRGFDPRAAVRRLEVSMRSCPTGRRQRDVARLSHATFACSTAR